MFNTIFNNQDQDLEQNLKQLSNYIAKLQEDMDIALEERKQIEQQIQARKTAKAAAQSALEQVNKAREVVAKIYGEQGLEEFNNLLLDKTAEQLYQDFDLIVPEDFEETNELDSGVIVPVYDDPLEVDEEEYQKFSAQFDINCKFLNEYFQQFKFSSLRHLAKRWNGTTARAMNDLVDKLKVSFMQDHKNLLTNINKFHEIVERSNLAGISSPADIMTTGL